MAFRNNEKSKNSARPIGGLAQKLAGATPSREVAYRFKEQTGEYFAARLAGWQFQVSADLVLAPTALRVALVLPYWLNSKTEECFPSQQTVATEIGCTERAVREALKQLVSRGHLARKPGKRGSYGTNTYKMVLRPEAKMRNIRASSQRDDEWKEVNMRNVRSGSTGTYASRDEEQHFRQTIERTKERTGEILRGGQVDPDDANHERGEDEQPDGKRLTDERRREIMHEKYGSAANENGFLLR